MTRGTAIRVAAIQVQSHNHRVRENLRHAAEFVARAAQAGAQMVVCPEFLATGYLFHESLWESGEPRGGPTEAWLAKQAECHHIYIGASYLEADGGDFFNTFTLVAPDGTPVGRVRKESLPGFEGWLFRSCPGDKVIPTPFGRVAVGICQDNQTARFMRRLRADDVDLILMPHSAPCVSPAAQLTRELLHQIAPFYARSFGVPVVLANKVHSPCRSPVPGVPVIRLPFVFPGLSAIVDSDGSSRVCLEDREDVIVADVHLDPSRKRRPDAPTDRYWSRRPKRFPRTLGAMFIALEHLGQRAYSRNPRRPAASLRAADPARQGQLARNTRSAG